MEVLSLEIDRVFGVVSGAGKDGVTITEIAKSSRLPRSVVRIALAWLDGAGKIKFRKVGMAKIYFLKENA